MRDFNAINHIKDRLNGSPMIEAYIRDFCEFMQSTGMMELKYIEYTFLQEALQHVLSTIDKR
ncbi:hypothetical protein RND71_019238 [Anisodus tanguticus]|uniref:Uncharacterized protein n=1 Tax=Anisodus tanguticus TaxID=243964 RepID=A0AAE1RYQ5_9SOLA|nr:hypothetical protein RND71_019238 [Anisodus tanguticus]